MEERTSHRSVRERSPLAVSAHSGGSARQIEALAMPPLPEEVQLLYERVERLAEQSSIAEQLQRENDELRIEVRELRGEVRALRRENMTLRSKDRADASDMVCRHAGVSRSSLRLRRSLCCSRHRGCARCAARSQAVTDSILTALHESELAQQTNREALIALRRHHAAQLAERDIEIARLRYVAMPHPNTSACSARPLLSRSITSPAFVSAQNHHPQRKSGCVLEGFHHARDERDAYSWPPNPYDSFTGAGHICSHINAAYGCLACGLSQHSYGRQ